MQERGLTGEGDPARERALELVEQGLLEHARGRFRLTERGWPLADAVAARFLEESRGGEKPRDPREVPKIVGSHPGEL